uniref:Uncharacterized protein n=1 Tax=Trypanosoma vivax (strain Y486) TaxID=1055687 RepID=G0TU41_TRYVY|nr:hypothetical protein, unlikely [Trypanosoma vivax Y486]
MKISRAPADEITAPFPVPTISLHLLQTVRAVTSARETGGTPLAELTNKGSGEAATPAYKRAYYGGWESTTLPCFIYSHHVSSPTHTNTQKKEKKKKKEKKRKR